MIWSYKICKQLPCITIHTYTITQLFYSPFSETTRVSRCEKKSSCGLHGAREDNRGRHIGNPAGCHSIQTNQRPNFIIPPFLRRMPFLLQPSQFILAWDRHQICWLAYPVAWFHVYNNTVQVFLSASVHYNISVDLHISNALQFNSDCEAIPVTFI